MRALLPFLVVAFASAENHTSENPSAEPLTNCDSVKDSALQLAKESVGFVAGSAWDAVRAACKANADETECNGADACTYCGDDKNCWPAVDTDNPCIATQVKILTTTANAAQVVGAAAVDVAGMATSAYIAKCEAYADKAACEGGILSGGLPGCEWCEKQTKCWIMGDLKHNKCLQEHLADMAKNTASDAAKAAADAGKAEVQKLMNACNIFDGNSTNCSMKAECFWCGSTSTGEVVNKCYFAGDVENKCLRAEVQKTIDAATGAAKAVGEWAGNQWNDAVEWSSNVCGQYNGEDKKDECDNKGECEYCSEDKNCYIVAVTNNPCGWAQKGIKATEEFIGNAVGGADECDSQDAYNALKQAQSQMQANLDFACTEYVKSNFYAERSFAALAKDASGAGDSLKKMAGVKVQQAQQHMGVAINATEAAAASDKAVAAMKSANPCVTDAAAAVLPGALLLYVLTISGLGH